MVTSAFADRENIVSFDENSSPNFPTSSNLLSETSFHDDLSSSSKIGGSSYLQQNASSPEYMHPGYSIEGLSSFGNCLHHVEPVGVGCDHNLDYPGEDADSILCNSESLNEALCGDELQYFDGDYAMQRSHLELSAAYIPCSDISVDKAQRGWNILVFVLRWWFSIKRRLVAKKGRI